MADDQQNTETANPARRKRGCQGIPGGLYQVKTDFVLALPPAELLAEARKRVSKGDQWWVGIPDIRVTGSISRSD